MVPNMRLTCYKVLNLPSKIGHDMIHTYFVKTRLFLTSDHFSHVFFTAASENLRCNQLSLPQENRTDACIFWSTITWNTNILPANQQFLLFAVLPRCLKNILLLQYVYIHDSLSSTVFRTVTDGCIPNFYISVCIQSNTNNPHTPITLMVPTRSKRSGSG